MNIKKIKKFNYRKCEICGRCFKEDLHCVAFIPIIDDNVIMIPGQWGNHFLACYECELSVDTQVYTMTNKEAEEHIQWIIDCVNQR